MKKHRTLWINIIFWVVFFFIILLDYFPIWSKDEGGKPINDYIILAFMNLLINCPLAFIFLFLFNWIYEGKNINKIFNVEVNKTYKVLTPLAIVLTAIILATLDGCIFLWCATGEFLKFEPGGIPSGIFSQAGVFNKYFGWGLTDFQVKKIHEFYRNIPEAFFSFGLFTGVRKAFEYLDTSRLLQLENERKDTQKSILESDLAHQKELSLSNEKNLRWQIKPHVLINAIETIDSYIELEEPKNASDMLKRVAKIQQYLLDKSTENVVFIEEELNFIEDYLSRYKVVNGDKFNYEFVKNNITQLYQIAPLLLIDLVENAIKYNNTKTPIRVFASVQNDWFTFEVQNTSNDIIHNENKTKRIGGIGLKNMEDRLSILYPDRFIFNKWEKDKKTDIISTSLKIKLS